MKPNPLTRQVWVFLLSQGGWWTVAEAIKHNPAWAESLSTRQQVSAALRNFHQYGSCEQRLPPGARDYQYAVTPPCVVPLGVTLRDIMEAVNAPAVEIVA